MFPQREVLLPTYRPAGIQTANVCLGNTPPGKRVDNKDVPVLGVGGKKAALGAQPVCIVIANVRFHLYETCVH